MGDVADYLMDQEQFTYDAHLGGICGEFGICHYCIAEEKLMAQGIIQQVKPSKSGKTLGVQIGGQWYSTKHFELQNMVGRELTFTTSSSEFNGNMMHWLNDYTVAGASHGTADQAFDAAYAQHKAEQGTAGPGGGTAVIGSGQNMSTSEPYFDPGQALPMTSNVVAHAIVAGLIKEPADVAAWAQAGFSAARGLITCGDAVPNRPSPSVGGGYPDRDEFGDEIPF